MRAKTPLRKGMDPEIGRLLQVRSVIQLLIQKTDTVLNAHDFPKTAQSANLLAKHFEAEIEANLLKTYRSLDDRSV
jgi:hypothetical protein